MAKFFSKFVNPFRPSPAPPVKTAVDFFAGPTMFESLQELILNRVPHTLVRGKTTKLSIPGIETRTETENALTIFLDMNGTDAKVTGVLSDVTVESNAVFFKSYFWKDGFTTTFNSRVNVEKNVYKTVETDLVNGGVMLTLYKDFHDPRPRRAAPRSKNSIPIEVHDWPPVPTV